MKDRTTVMMNLAPTARPDPTYDRPAVCCTAMPCHAMALAVDPTPFEHVEARMMPRWTHTTPAA